MPITELCAILLVTCTRVILLAVQILESFQRGQCLSLWLKALHCNHESLSVVAAGGVFAGRGMVRPDGFAEELAANGSSSL